MYKIVVCIYISYWTLDGNLFGTQRQTRNNYLMLFRWSELMWILAELYYYLLNLYMGYAAWQILQRAKRRFGIIMLSDASSSQDQSTNLP